jgi:hypothetical protein
VNLWQLLLRNRIATLLFALNLCFFIYGASSWWRESQGGSGCSSVAEARVSDSADCHFLFTTGFMVGGFIYIFPDILNRLTVVPLVHSFSSLCNCTGFRIEIIGILVFSSLQAILIGYVPDRLVSRKGKAGHS